jgi:hypothetical protein
VVALVSDTYCVCVCVCARVWEREMNLHSEEFIVTLL